MAEDRVEIEKNQSITVEMVLKSIEETEGWYKQLKTVIDQGRPVSEFISGVISVLNQMEAAAKNPRLPQTKEEAEKIKALWVISAPGTYFQAEKADRYRGKKWSLWNDRQRINYAFKLGRQIAEIKLGHPVSKNWNETEKEITDQGPMIIYNGTPQEDAAISEAVNTPWLRIPQGLEYPKTKVYVINPMHPIDNTSDQIRTFRLSPSIKINNGDEIGLILHAPQSMRFLHTLNLFNMLPVGINLRVFPLGTSPGGYPDYPLQELRGMVNYRFIADPPKLAQEAFPHKV